MSGAPPTRELIGRLDRADLRARRVAILDLTRRVNEAEALDALIARLGVEGDERALVLICRALAGVQDEAGSRRALDALVARRDDPKSSAPVAHAAILAHDRLERLFRST